MVDIDITGQYQINGVPIGGSSNPSVIDLSVTDGTAVTGTLVMTASRILTIPANTFTTNGMLEMVARQQKTGTAGSHSSAVYLNTSPTLTGATQIAVFSTTSSILIQGIRTARINSNTLTIWPTISVTSIDYASTSNALISATFNTSVDNYLIFAVQLFNLADSTVIEMARAVKYLEV
jgi:hypothetical protein